MVTGYLEFSMIAPIKNNQLVLLAVGVREFHIQVHSYISLHFHSENVASDSIVIIPMF